MTDAPPLGQGSLLDFMGPLSADRAARLVRDLAGDPRRSPAGVLPQSVLDLGCGWGELLLRLVAALPKAYGTGVDTHGPDLERGRAAAAERGLADRVTFVDGEAATLTGPADLVLSIGAYQAFGGIAEALTELRSRVASGGRLLFGAEFWEQTPPSQRLANMWDGMTLESCLYLPQLVDAAVAAGFRPLSVEVASRAEWDEFESGLAAQSELWLLAHPDHAEAAELRAKLDAQRDIWLRGHQGYLGFAYLTLGVGV